jgi:hypothetical protein
VGIQPPEPSSDSALTVGGCYLVLLLLGVAEGLIGSFQYSRGIGPVPAAAIGFALLILFTCVLAAWGMQASIAALMPAVGWFAASFVLAMSTPGGSIVITNTTAGKWYLFGGAAGAAGGVVAGFTRWSALRTQRQGVLRQPAGGQHAVRRNAGQQNARGQNAGGQNPGQQNAGGQNPGGQNPGGQSPARQNPPRHNLGRRNAVRQIARRPRKPGR